jgi:acetylornithine deacetylase/succinyl-diaminopimelate desuccinylase-like protein
VSADRIRRDLFYLCRDPLPFRKVNYTRPGQSVNSLAEADAYIRGQLESAGYDVTATRHQVQAWRCDKTKPLHHWYSPPDPGDPWYEAANLEVNRVGRAHPQEMIQLISPKDSQSWIDSPGAHDNATGVAANLELARILAARDLPRSVRILFCNEEHWPWTSRFAAQAAAARGDRIIAVLNQVGLDDKPDADMLAGKLIHSIAYSTDEGRLLAEFIAACALRHRIGLDVRIFAKPQPNGDDGMYIKAGFPSAVMNTGGGGDSEYHMPGDIPERVNLENLLRSTQLLLAAVLEIAEGGANVLSKKRVQS